MEAATVMWAVAAVGGSLIYWFVRLMGAAEVHGKRAVDLKMGSITNDNVQGKYRQYWSFFHRPKDAAASEKTPAFVDTSSPPARATRSSTSDVGCEVIQGNFLEMPFADASFAGAYSIEATCHAPASPASMQGCSTCSYPAGFMCHTSG